MQVHQGQPYDKDIEHLKSLIAKLGNNKQEPSFSHDHSSEELQERNRELVLKVESLSKEAVIKQGRIRS